MITLKLVSTQFVFYADLIDDLPIWILMPSKSANEGVKVKVAPASEKRDTEYRRGDSRL